MVLRASDKYQYKILTGCQNIELRQELISKMFSCFLQFIIMSLFFAVAMFYLKKEAN